MITLLAYVFVLGVLIFVHELGHFVMARRIGVRVLTFSLGFGPKLLSFKYGDTVYCLSAIPLGGYVKMAGERAEDATPGAADEFMSKTKWQRFQVLVMGPIMNLALAVIVMAVVLYQRAELPAFNNQPVVVGTVVEKSVAAEAGVRPGDLIVAVNGERIPNWERFAVAIMSRPGKPVDLDIRREGRSEHKHLVPVAVGKYEVGNIGVQPPVRPQILSVTPGTPAANAGLKAKDVIVALDGAASPDYDRIISRIRESGGNSVTLGIDRGGVRQTVSVTPRSIDGVMRIGADINRFELRDVKVGAVEAVKMSVARNWQMARMIVQTVAGLATGETPVKTLMGPVAIVDIAGTAARIGWTALFSLMAMLSLNLGLLNLLPIPVLDGGHIAILAMEGVSRRDFSLAVKEKLSFAGFVFLLMLMGTVIFNDLTRLILR